MAELSLINKVPTRGKAVAFTFDDGPDPLYTRQIMDIFREVNGHATFFMIGRQIELYGDLAAEVHAAGHEIANHTYTHPDLTKLTLKEVRTELELADSRIRQVTGKQASHFRPPYFAVTPEIIALAAEMGYTSIGCVNGEAKDWEQPGVGFIVDQTRLTVESGSVFLFHDGYGERSQTVEAVRILVQELSAEGFSCVTVSELLQSAAADQV
ncbi:polysaccharide deacetylase family protein [Paenibacillus physcomitrellae]|uniref:Oligosaccharide deacetylase n=1 Tax=Paenibacillus physcomitrellae TaxID=1619311 RepID=A0ABQ1GC42_9BACL|nr:polysaccharide deacetylase family protein [Paenibacillus physcomitrellae]GGA40776.1 oligosaccharide deacetylase [Paenibacillus physcomitrellae]